MLLLVGPNCDRDGPLGSEGGPILIDGVFVAGNRMAVKATTSASFQTEAGALEFILFW